MLRANIVLQLCPNGYCNKTDITHMKVNFAVYIQCIYPKHSYYQEKLRKFTALL